MPSHLYNNVTDSLSLSVAPSDTEITVSDGSKFSDPPDGDYFPIYVILSNGSFEIMHVTGVSGDVLTVTRAAEGTSPLAFSGSETVQIRPTSESLLDLDIKTYSSYGPGDPLSKALDDRSPDGFSPFDIRNFGGVPDDSGVNNLQAINSALSEYGRVDLVDGGFYNVDISQESDSITGGVINFSGPAIRHTASSLVLFNLEDSELQLMGSPRFLYAGTYPTNNGSVTKYGQTQPSDAQFCGFILASGDSKIVAGPIECRGETDSNKYDFFFRGRSGDFSGSFIGDCKFSHYARAISDNVYGMRWGEVSGTLRHNDCHDHYGPGHLSYTNMTRCRVEGLVESGPLLSNLGGDAGATLQTTDFDDGYVGYIVTTMDNVGPLSMKVAAGDFYIGPITSRSDNFTSDPLQNRALVLVQTNFQDDITDGFIGPINVTMPPLAQNIVGAWFGGSRIRSEVNIKAPNYENSRNADLVSVVTSREHDITVNIDTDRTDDTVFISGAERNSINITTNRYPVTVGTYTNYAGSTWGLSSGNEITFKDFGGLGDSDVDWENRQELSDNIVLRPLFYRKTSVVTSSSSGVDQVDRKVFLDDAGYSSLSNGSYVYKLYARAEEQGANYVGFVEYLVVIKDGSATPKTITLNRLHEFNTSTGGSDEIIFSEAVNAGENSVTITANLDPGRMGRLELVLERIHPRSFP